eukprot:COSAG04_NODE_3342_length_2911_cov_11.837127_4_plen_176_part_00
MRGLALLWQPRLPRCCFSPPQGKKRGRRAGYCCCWGSCCSAPDGCCPSGCGDRVVEDTVALLLHVAAHSDPAPAPHSERTSRSTNAATPTMIKTMPSRVVGHRYTPSRAMPHAARYASQGPTLSASDSSKHLFCLLTFAASHIDRSRPQPDTRLTECQVGSTSQRAASSLSSRTR